MDIVFTAFHMYEFAFEFEKSNLPFNSLDIVSGLNIASFSLIKFPAVPFWRAPEY